MCNCHYKQDSFPVRNFKISRGNITSFNNLRYLDFFRAIV